jgi:hypothetical protein
MFRRVQCLNRRILQILHNDSKEGAQTLFKSSCFTIVYKNFDISGLFGMVGPLLKLARVAMVRRYWGCRRERKGARFARFGELCESSNVEHLGMS